MATGHQRTLTCHCVVVPLLLQFAATDGAKHSAGCLELLLKHGAKTGNSPSLVCATGFAVSLRFYLCPTWQHHDADGLILGCADAVDNEFDMTAWLWACDHGRSACLQPLIDAGASALLLAHRLLDPLRRRLALRDCAIATLWSRSTFLVFTGG